ncbi:hypothetical protein MYCTH_2063953, partial [Thermothelomyces thermophilus ATCC 42464]
NVFVPLAIEEFNKDFSNYEVISFLDLFSRYDQVSLNERSRDLTTFQTPISLFWIYTLPIGGTNSIA